MTIEKEGQPRGETVHVEACAQRGVHILDAVGEREGQLLDGGRARLAHVIAADRNRVPLRNFLGAVREHVGDQAETRARWINVRTPRDVLLQNVVLECSAQRFRVDTLLFRHGDVER